MSSSCLDYGISHEDGSTVAHALTVVKLWGPSMGPLSNAERDQLSCCIGPGQAGKEWIGLGC